MLKLIYSDVYDLHNTLILRGKAYLWYSLINTQIASMLNCCILKTKLMRHLVCIKLKLNCKMKFVIKYLLSKKGAEYYYTNFFKYMRIIHETIISYTLQQNGVVNTKIACQ